MKKLTLLFSLLSTVSICTAQSKFGWAKSAVSDGSVVPIKTVVDATGNVYTTGYFSDDTNFDPASGTQLITPVGNNDIFITKRDATGNLLWVKTIGDVNDNQPAGMMLDASGNVYLTGNFVGTLDFDPGPATHSLTNTNSTLTEDNVFILKLDADGEYVWAKSFAGNNIENSAVAIDAAGNVYTTGYFSGIADFDPGTGIQNQGTLNSNSLFISKLNKDGDYVWAKNVTGSGAGLAIAVDPLGNVYTTGYFTSPIDFDPGTGTVTLDPGVTQDVFFLKLDVNGDYVWAKQISSTSTDLFPSGIAVDAFGAIYVTGWFEGTVDYDPSATATQDLTAAGNEDVYILKLDASGKYEWATQIGDVNSDYGSSITLDAMGNVYATGYFTGNVDVDPGTGTHQLSSAGDADIYIVKLTSNGAYSWATSLGGTANDIGTSIAVTGTDNIYLAGIFQGTVDFDPGTGTKLLSTPDSGGFMLHLTPAGSLPLTLLNFEAVDNNTTVQLQWQTTREEDMAGFTIERSANGKQFETIGSAAVNNSFNLVSNYAFTDAHPLTTPSYYRLKVNDQNGSFTYSRTIPVKRQGKAQSLQVAPNPATNVLYVQVDAHEAITLQIADVTGHIVYKQNKNINGNTTFPVSIQSLPAGNYYFIMKGKTIQKTQQFLKH
jgi:hypothetical protein